jgi:hypothetical protein
MLDPYVGQCEKDAGGSTVSNSKDELPQQEQESSIASIDKIPKQQQQPQSTTTCNDTTTTTHTSLLLKPNDIASTKRRQSWFYTNQTFQQQDYKNKN